MWYIREKLKHSAPELYAALERSWDIALNEWLPALDMKMDSANSYPHIRNVEFHLDHVALGCEGRSGGAGELFSSPIEIYVMLCSILLHDIGKCNPGKTPKGEDRRHGEASAEFIRKHRAELGLPRDDIADVVARICDFHDCPHEEAESALDRLNVALIEPYGEVRERYLAALLALVDHLDTSGLRVVPRYLKALDEMGISGAFRSAIRGVTLVLEGQYVEVDLSEEKLPPIDLPPSVTPVSSLDAFRFSWDMKDNPKLIGRLSPAPAEKQEFTYSEWVDSKFHVDPPVPQWNRLRSPENPAIFEKLNIRIPFDLSFNWAVSYGLLKIEKSSTRQGSWPGWLILAKLLGDLHSTNAALRPIVPTLRAMGIPFTVFLLEYKEHLFTENGDETYEPVFYREYLERTAECMWRLSTGVFGCDAFSFAMLASEMRESDEGKIRLAVRRIAILMTNDGICANLYDDLPRCAAKGLSAIWIGEHGWRWNVEFDNPERREGCVYFDLESVNRRIAGLAPPTKE